MRIQRWISILTVLCLLCATMPAALADDEIIEASAEDLEITFSEALDGENDSQDIELTFDEDDVEELPGEVDLIIPDEAVLEDAPVEKTNASPVANDSGDFEIDENGVLIKYNGFDKNVVIPDGVTGIGYHAFENDNIIVSVNFPNSVTYIEGWAFSGCVKLKSITVPNSVTEIGYSAFSRCSSLANVQLPSTLTRLNDGIFSYCYSLESITLPTGVTDIGVCAFSGCTGLKAITFPETVVTIGESAFSFCDSLKSVTLPKRLSAIEETTFSDCFYLESVSIPANVTAIDRSAFSNSDNVVIRGTAGSYAEKYANGMGIPFNAPVVSFNEEELIVYANQTRELKTVQKPSDLATTLKWSSSNTKVATVDQNGKVKGVSQGTATITAATANGKGKAAQIQVYVPEPTTIYLEKVDKVALGETLEIFASRNTPYDYETNASFPITWTTSDKTIVSVEKREGGDSVAIIKGLKLGKATVTATTSDGGKAAIVIEVRRPDPATIEINQQDTIQLTVGKTYALSASVFPEEALQTVTWRTDDSNVATVNAKGVVTAVGAGWTHIWVESVKSQYGWSRTDSILVEVAPPAPTSVKFSNSKLTMGLYESLTVSIVLSPANAESELTVASSNASVAEGWYNYDGTITVFAYKKGAATITVTTENGKKATATVTVKAAPKKVALNKKGTVKLTLGNTLQLKATLPKDTASALTWTSSQPGIATVDQNGKVAPVKAGTATITVKTFNNKKATVKVTVKNPVPTKVTLNKTAATLDVSDAPLTLAATVSPANAPTTLTWTSSKPKIARVDKKTGRITPLKAGKAVITVKTSNGKKAKATITVTARPKSVALNKTGVVSLNKGKTLKLKATLSKGSSSTLTWTSNMPKVATVNKSGKVTAKSAGTAVITVRTSNGLTASVTIVVK